MRCPRCGLINPDRALRCDCGYDFATGRLESSHLTTAQIAKQVPSQLIPAILVGVLCGLLPAAPALYYALETRKRIMAGDFAGARASSRRAKLWLAIGAGVGLVMWIIVQAIRPR